MLESIYRVFVPAGLMILMFGMGMQLVVGDWLRMAQYPRAILVGLAGQFILLPAIAFLMVYTLSLPLAVSAGLVILAVCPGGVVSNSISFLARADIPLSVTLTALSSVLALVTVPVILDAGLDFVQRDNATLQEGSYVKLPISATVKQLMLLVFIPLAAGMAVRRIASDFAKRSDSWMRVIGVVVLLVLLIGSVALEFDFFIQNLGALWPVLLLLNIATLAAGYTLALAFKVERLQRRTIAIEVGVQNVALGVMIALNILERSDWAVVPSVYSVVMMTTAFVIILYTTGFAGKVAAKFAGPMSGRDKQ